MDEENAKIYEEIIHSRTKPDLDQIVVLAKALEIKEVTQFWTFFDKIHQEWRDYWTSDNSWDPP